MTGGYCYTSPGRYHNGDENHRSAPSAHRELVIGLPLTGAARPNIPTFSSLAEGNADDGKLNSFCRIQTQTRSTGDPGKERQHRNHYADGHIHGGCGFILTVGHGNVPLADLVALKLLKGKVWKLSS